MDKGSIWPMTGMLLRFIPLLGAAAVAACGEPASEQLPDYGKSLPTTATFVSARNFGARGLLWLSNSSSGIQFSMVMPEALTTEPVVTILCTATRRHRAKLAATSKA